MANNDFRPCVYIIPEDDANRQIADGFSLHHRVTNQVQIMPVAGGWENVVKVIEEEYYPKLRNRITVTVVGLIDCDEQSDRIGDILHATPKDIRDRIFFLGVLKNPETLKAIVKQHFEAIGEKLAIECGCNRRSACSLWRLAESG